MTVSTSSTEGIPTFSTHAEQYEAGKALGAKAPRTSYGGWASASNPPDLIRLLEETNYIRVPELVPIHYGRMTGTRQLTSRITESFIFWFAEHCQSIQCQAIPARSFRAM
jgi:hypothetical protein